MAWDNLTHHNNGVIQPILGAYVLEIGNPGVYKKNGYKSVSVIFMKIEQKSHSNCPVSPNPHILGYERY